MAKPFPDMDYWGAFMAMGPAPLGNASQAAELRQPAARRTVPTRSRTSRPTRSWSWSRTTSGSADSDPARHQYADEWIFKFNQDQAKVDQIMLSGNSDSQTAVATSLGSDKYTEANGRAR